MKEKFKIPMVVRQKGLIDDTLKVYMENKVLQYIKELKNKSMHNVYAMLIGKLEDIEEEKCLIIDGLVKCNCKHHKNLDDYFLKQVKGYMQKQVEKYFPDEDIVGIVYIDCMRQSFNEGDIRDGFKKIFKNEYNMLFIQEKHSEELIYNLEGKLEGLKGYFVYYQKNENMQGYIKDNPVSFTLDNNDYVYNYNYEHHNVNDNNSDGNNLDRNKVNINAMSENNVTDFNSNVDKLDNENIDENINVDSNVINSNIKLDKEVIEKKTQYVITNKRGSNFVTASLFVICMILGIGLTKNIEVVKRLEQRIRSMNEVINLNDDEITQVSNITLDHNNVNTNDNSEKELNMIVKNKLSNFFSSKLDSEMLKVSSPNLDSNVDANLNLNSNESTLDNDLENVNANNVDSYYESVSVSDVETENKNQTETESTNLELNNVDSENKDISIPNEVTYHVEKGDNLKSISRKFFNNDKMVQVIKETNNIENENLIKIGQVLVIPKVN